MFVGTFCIQIESLSHFAVILIGSHRSTLSENRGRSQSVACLKIHVMGVVELAFGSLKVIIG